MILVYLLLLDFGFTSIEAALGSLIFAIHPLAVESVAWVASRKNLLAALFGLAFVYSFLNGRRALAVGMLMLALGSKGTAVVFPAWALAATWLGFGKLTRREARLWLIPFALMVIARWAISATSMHEVIAGRVTGTLSFADRMAIMGPVTVAQLRQFLWPYDLCLRYSPYWSSFIDPWVIASWLVLFGGAFYLLTRRDPKTTLATFITITALLPTLNIFPAPEFHSDRYFHLALVGLSALTITLIPRQHHAIGTVVVLAWLVFLLPVTRARIAVWHDAGTLWTDVIAKQPTLAFAWAQLASFHYSQRNWAEAGNALRRTLELAPESCATRFNLGLVLLESGAAHAAVREAQDMASLCPEQSVQLVARIDAGRSQ